MVNRVTRVLGLAVCLAALTVGCGETRLQTRTVTRPPPTPVPSETPEPARLAVSTVTVAPASKPGGSVPHAGEGSGGGEGGNTGVSGGGPAGDPEAVARIEAQFPMIPGDITLGGDSALAYMDRLKTLVPGLPQMTAVTKVSNCAFTHGLVGVKAYVTPNLSRAGAVVVVSERQLDHFASIAARCFIEEVSGGGGGGFDPCYESYSIRDSVAGVDDKYYIFVAGTSPSFCSYVHDSHRNFDIQPFSF
jgi:hypothetical protein